MGGKGGVLVIWYIFYNLVYFFLNIKLYLGKKGLMLFCG